MKCPRALEFIGNYLTVLSQRMLAEAPNEGCALLIGTKKQSCELRQEDIFQVQMIWPCCNVWAPEIVEILEPEKKTNIAQTQNLSKESRFIIDPKEQLNAQRWAREHHLTILGSAHSHPQGAAIPSAVDLFWSFAPRLMVIIGELGDVRAWWLEADPKFPPKEVAIWEG